MSQGVNTLRGKRSNQWNEWVKSNEGHYSEADYITALQLRTTTYLCRATFARAGGTGDTLCRRCHLTAETLGQISGHCPSVKNYRVRQYNAVTEALWNKAKDHLWYVPEEPRIRDAGGQVWKTDLVMVKDRKAVVIDPTIVLEKGDSLGEANRQKVGKYSGLTPQIKELYGVDEVIATVLAIGCRGGWHTDNDKPLNVLGIKDPGFVAHLCRLALKGTINIVRLFNDM